MKISQRTSIKCSEITPFKISDDYYISIDAFINCVKKMRFSKAYQRKKTGGYYVYNVPVSFDIETSSFYNDKHEKQSIMYIWQFGINGVVIIGRTWNKFLQLIDELVTILNLSDKLRLYVYVHNLSYEFQYMRKWFTWVNVFAVDVRKPIKALTTNGIEFRDSYILSGYGLEKTGEQLQKYKVKKQVGLLDYYKVRTPITPLTGSEIKYCIYDILVVMAYIQEQIDEYGNIVKIPLTNTGRVRAFCRERCFYGFSKDKNIRQQNYYNYRSLMNSLTLTADEYTLLKESFQGGFTHANAIHVGDILTNVTSFDFTSSYPAVMLSEKYPMGKGFKINISDLKTFQLYNSKFFLVFYVRLINVSPRIFADNPISQSKCIKCVNPIINNGRVVYADEIVLACNNIDLKVYADFYYFEHLEISNCYAYALAYLPKNFILSILELYGMKTKLKGVDGKEIEYLHGKGMLNSCYGMTVTDIVRDILNYSDNWNEPIPADAKEQIEKYNSSKQRFLFYPWGCAVTSYARRNLFSAIKECANDYAYSDTDSVKILNAEKHKQYFDNYNKQIKEKLKAVADYYKIDFELFQPKTVKGVKKLIGVWDFDGNYKMFKTLGAKRYLYLTDNEKVTATVAGVSKKGIVKYLQSKYGNNYNKIFNAFNTDLIVPSDYTGKLTHTYIDNEMQGTVTDYDGIKYNYYEKSGIHLSPTGYDMSISQLYLDYIRGVKYET